MLPLEMVYDFDPIPPQPEYGGPEPIMEDGDALQSREDEMLDDPSPAEAMSEIGRAACFSPSHP